MKEDTKVFLAALLLSFPLLGMFTYHWIGMSISFAWGFIMTWYGLEKAEDLKKARGRL